MKQQYKPEEIRAKLAAEAPEMLKLVDTMRQEFGAKVTYVQCGDMEIGRPSRPKEEWDEN